jgi:hypothetical protein
METSQILGGKMYDAWDSRVAFSFSPTATWKRVKIRVITRFAPY